MVTSQYTTTSCTLKLYDQLVIGIQKVRLYGDQKAVLQGTPMIVTITDQHAGNIPSVSLRIDSPDCLEISIHPYKAPGHGFRPSLPPRNLFFQENVHKRLLLGRYINTSLACRPAKGASIMENIRSLRESGILIRPVKNYGNQVQLEICATLDWSVVRSEIA